MKHLAYIVFVFLLLACGNAQQEVSTTSTDTTPATTPIIDSGFFPSDSIGAEGTASTALDVAGTYKGMLPCADCEGINTTLQLNLDSTFVLKTQYEGKANSNPDSYREQTVQGSWKWVTGNVIELSNVKDAPNRYFVSENKVIQLDMQGNKITGNLADKYILTKAQ
jgi:uncharacterized lipoprotein NlpE involved in copper resistance